MASASVDSMEQDENAANEERESLNLHPSKGVYLSAKGLEFLCPLNSTYEKNHSNDIRVNNLVTLTITLSRKVAILDLNVTVRGISVLFLCN